MTGLEKELHRTRPQAGAAEPEDAARTALKERVAQYNAIPVPKGLPELPPSTLTERPTPLKMPMRRPTPAAQHGRPIDREAKGPDPAETPLTLPESADQPTVQAVPLGETALQQMVSENLGEAYVRPEQVTPPAEPQA